MWTLLSADLQPGEGFLKKVLYGEAPPRDPTPYPFIYHFFQKKALSYTFLRRLMNKSLKQEVFLSFFFHVTRNKLNDWNSHKLRLLDLF